MNDYERQNRNREGREMGCALASFGGPLGFLVGFISCTNSFAETNTPSWSDPFVFSLIGALLSFGIGFIWGIIDCKTILFLSNF